MVNFDADCCGKVLRVILLVTCALSILGFLGGLFTGSFLFSLVGLAFALCGAYGAYKKDYKYLTYVSN